MDISLPNKDYRVVAELMDTLLEAEDTEQRGGVFAQICRELTPEGEADADIRQFLDRLNALPIDSEEWIEQFSAFQQALTKRLDLAAGDIFACGKMAVPRKLRMPCIA